MSKFDEKMKSPLVAQMAELLDTTPEELAWTLSRTYDLEKVPETYTKYLENILFLDTKKRSPGREYMPNCIAVLEKHPEVVDGATLQRSREALVKECLCHVNGEDVSEDLYKQWVAMNSRADMSIVTEVLADWDGVSIDDFRRAIPWLIAMCEQKLQ